LNNTLNLAGYFSTISNIYPVCSWIAKTLYPAHPYKELQVRYEEIAPL
jgi:hypothetical protein